jgi:hypothetical protein
VSEARKENWGKKIINRMRNKIMVVGSFKWVVGSYKKVVG